ncbi:hypothetical protein VHEMI04417 [[Torrubiella] hemipterigena]|uniref:Uncharacterized protein n=1 Tax=[Torrubiella] hemipterigena TaxID=1531966 RepID=A0A0A1TDR4_9HYPO|nr:hypothetical protein VHEMI04417 [[Torrubiella] hemipterigena]
MNNATPQCKQGRYMNRWISRFPSNSALHPRHQQSLANTRVSEVLLLYILFVVIFGKSRYNIFIQIENDSQQAAFLACRLDAVDAARRRPRLIINAEGHLGGKAIGLGVEPNNSRSGTTRAPFQMDATFFGSGPGQQSEAAAAGAGDGNTGDKAGGNSGSGVKTKPRIVYNSRFMGRAAPPANKQRPQHLNLQPHPPIHLTPAQQKPVSPMDRKIDREAALAMVNPTGLGATLARGNNSLEQSFPTIMAANGGQKLSQVYGGGELYVFMYQVNGDGAGPYQCYLSADATGDKWSPMEIVQNAPGLRGRNSDTKMSTHPLILTVPSGETCTGKVSGESGVCLVRCQNEAAGGPFGGVVPIQIQSRG